MHLTASFLHVVSNWQDVESGWSCLVTSSEDICPSKRAMEKLVLCAYFSIFLDLKSCRVFSILMLSDTNDQLNGHR